MDYSGYEYIVTEYDGGVLTVMFNRPEARNALNPGMQREFRDILEKLETDEEVGAVILTGAGDHGFCAGVDIKSRESMVNDTSGANSETERSNTALHSYIGPKRMIERILNVEAPIVVAL